MKNYNTAIIGAGASGLIAAIKLDDPRSILLEKNNVLGKKILITGGGRCNITNTSPLKDYIKSYYPNGNYYHEAFSTFFYDDIIELLESNGCKTKIEDEHKVFPTTDSAKTVNNTLIKILQECNTNYKTKTNVNKIKKENDHFIITYNGKTKIRADNVILATGSSAYPRTGSDGSGAKLAESMGHSKTPFIAALAPVKIKEDWINNLQGITVEAKIEFKTDKKRISTQTGSIIFTHNGISGYPIFNESMKIDSEIKKDKTVKIYLDFIPSMNYENLDQKMQEDFKEHANWGLKRYLHEFLPKNMTPVFLKHLDIDETTILNQVNKKQRNKIRDALKKTILTIDKVLDDQAMVENSGIPQKEIDPNSCMSKIVENLYITGELIEGCGICGGFNLQKAYSTGALAAKSIKEKHT